MQLQWDVWEHNSLTHRMILNFRTCEWICASIRRLICDLALWPWVQRSHRCSLWSSLYLVLRHKYSNHPDLLPLLSHGYGPPILVPWTDVCWTSLDCKTDQFMNKEAKIDAVIYFRMWLFLFSNVQGDTKAEYILKHNWLKMLADMKQRSLAAVVGFFIS